MKNIVVINSNSPGGSESFLAQTACHLAETAETEIWFLRYRTPSKLRIENPNVRVRVLSRKSESLGLLMFCFHALGFTKDCRIFVSMFQYNVVISLLKRLTGRRWHLICRENTMMFSRFSGALMTFLKMAYSWSHKSIDWHVFQTTAQLEEFQANLNSPLRNAEVKRNFLFRRVGESCEYTREKPYLLAVGRLIPLKGFQDIIKALARCQSLADLELVIVGDGPFREELESLALENEIANRVIFEGHQTDVRPYMESADLCVISSYVEGFPNVLNEMIQYNGRVIVSRSFDLADDIPVLGTFEPGDIISLTELIQKYISLVDIPEGRDEYLQTIDISTYWERITENESSHSFR